MAAQRHRPAAFPHVTQLRMTPLQRRYLLFLAARDESTISEVLRAMVDRSLAAARVPIVTDESEVGTPAAGSIALAALLEGLADDDVEELARHHGA